jgi:hypothetical protein
VREPVADVEPDLPVVGVRHDGGYLRVPSFAATTLSLPSGSGTTR